MATFLISTSEVPAVNKTDLQALTLAGPTVIRLVQDPLAVLSLYSRGKIVIMLSSSSL